MEINDIHYQPLFNEVYRRWKAHSQGGLLFHQLSSAFFLSLVPPQGGKEGDLQCQPQEVDISFTSGPLALRLSPSLVHTITMTTALWLPARSGREPIISGRYIIRNNTIEDLSLRQVRSVIRPEKVALIMVFSN